MCYTINAKIFQGLGPKRRESCDGDWVLSSRKGGADRPERAARGSDIGGDNLSNTTRLTRVFFKRGELCSK